MKSFEKSHKSADLDQVDPEHLNRETAEFSWDDLSNVPFSGNQEKPNDAINGLKTVVDSLPADGDDETERAITAEKARQRVLDSMQDVGAFGKGFRNGRKQSSIEETKDKANNSQSLSDISSTF